MTGEGTATGAFTTVIPFVELSGDWIYASPNHNRFGIEHTDGNVELSPKDGRFLWHWATPGIPEGWHGLVIDPASATTIVEIRK